MKTIYLYQPQESQQCGYLPDKDSKNLYTDPQVELSQADQTQLSLLGFRRSGHLMYRPACSDCSACQSLRQDCRILIPSKSRKRLAKQFRNIRWSIEKPYFDNEIFLLFDCYIEKRHRDGDMYPASSAQFQDFLVNNYGNTSYLLGRIDNQLIACIVIDHLEDGLSSVYSFYQPDLSSSLGTHLIHQVSTLCHLNGLNYHYLGYFVSGCKKMAYKRRFKPAQIFDDGQWRWLD